MCASGQFRRIHKDDRGSAAIEFAIVAPAFLVLLFGILAFGWAINAISSVNFAAERAARAFQLKPTMTAKEIEAAIEQRFSYLDQSNLTVTLTTDTLSGGYRLGHVTATYSLVIEVPLLGTYPVDYSSTVTVPLLAS